MLQNTLTFFYNSHSLKAITAEGTPMIEQYSGRCIEPKGLLLLNWTDENRLKDGWSRHTQVDFRHLPEIDSCLTFPVSSTVPWPHLCGSTNPSIATLPSSCHECAVSTSSNASRCASKGRRRGKVVVLPRVCFSWNNVDERPRRGMRHSERWLRWVQIERSTFSRERPMGTNWVDEIWGALSNSWNS